MSEIKEVQLRAARVLRELDLDINTYPCVAWHIPWGFDSVNDLKGIIDFYEKKKIKWLSMLAGQTEITKNTLLEFVELADLEIEGAKNVLFMITAVDEI